MKEKIKLNKNIGGNVIAYDYNLDPTKKYVVNMWEEIDEQAKILLDIREIGLLAVDDYFKWLRKNKFSEVMPNPTNEVVGKYYGKKALWKTDFSQGIAMKMEGNTDFIIVMECSRLNNGFKHTQIIVTLGGCM